MRKSNLVIPSLLLPLVLSSGGCDYLKGFASDVRPPLLTREGRRLDLGEGGDPGSYPLQTAFGEPMDVEVIRTGNGIQLDNRTPRSYPDASLWLNQEYGARVDEIVIGRGGLIALRSFINHHREHYPVARFLQPDADRSLVSAELLIDGKLHPLIVRLEDNWREP